MGKLLIRGGRVICPAQDIDEVTDVLLADGLIAAVGACDEAAETLDAAGCIVAPGLIALHVRFRAPGPARRPTSRPCAGRSSTRSSTSDPTVPPGR